MLIDLLALKRLAYFVPLLVGAFSSISCGQQHDNKYIHGIWTAEDSLNGVLYKHVLQLDEIDGEGLAVSARATYLGHPVRMQFDTAFVYGDSVRFWSDNTGIKDIFKGKLDGDVISGEFTRNDQTREMTFRRFDLKAHRPQTPIRPFPYVEEEVHFANRDSSVVFSGTFTFPKGGGRYPAVLVATGSGPQDRDGDLYFHDPYLVIADYLTRHGIAVLRLDDRNVGRTVEAPGAKVDFVDDAMCAIEFLRGHANVDCRRIGIVGHSQGGLIAMEVAAAVPDLAAVVSLGSPISVTGGDYFLNHYEPFIANMTHQSKKKVTRLMSEIFNMIKETPSKRRAADLILDKLKIWLEYNRDDKEALSAFLFTPDDVANEMAIREMLEKSFGYYFSRDHYYILSYDPDAVFPKITCPVLAIYGGHDNRISFPAEEERLDFLVSRSGIELEAKCFARMNHFLQTSNSMNDTEVFESDETVSPEVLELLKHWLIERLNAD
ncbi:alpha/beta hydrolase [Parapedobacter tibetensis]|uniref:alpha/beta hydrolase n=1 Tax=Parapedobacter tibetensis TaxID=2972951 RepID=UPI00214DC789|nr:alpha/beta hydrolase [Parapedobacter tibetensis]